MGCAIAVHFAQEGAQIAIHDIDDTRAATTAICVCNLGRKALVIRTDVASTTDVQGCLRAVAEAFGRIDVLVNNAGINIARPVEEYPDEDWRRLMGINLDGVWFFCRYTVPYFVEKGG